MPKRQRQALVVLLLCIVFFFLGSGSVVALLMEDFQAASIKRVLPVQTLRPAASAAPETPPDDAFSGGALPKGEDAGEAYLEETLWIGDSNTVRMYLYGLVPLENYMATEGIGVESVTDVPCVSFVGDAQGYTIAQAIARVQPRRVVMTFGTNNADGNYTCEEFIALYADAVKALQKAAPDCDIIVNSIPPVGEARAYPYIQMETIDAFNTALEAYCTENRLAFLPSYKALKAKNGYAKPEYLVADGLHMSEDGLARMMQYLREHPLVSRRQSAAHSSPPQRSPPQFS